MRAVRFKISGELLRQALHMPENSRFLLALADPRGDVVEVVVDHPSIPEADLPHDVDPTIHETPEHRIEWDWNVPVVPNGAA